MHTHTVYTSLHKHTHTSTHKHALLLKCYLFYRVSHTHTHGTVAKKPSRRRRKGTSVGSLCFKLVPCTKAFPWLQPGVEIGCDYFRYQMMIIIEIVFAFYLFSCSLSSVVHRSAESGQLFRTG